jgi:hypothetical protein
LSVMKDSRAQLSETRRVGVHSKTTMKRYEQSRSYCMIKDAVLVMRWGLRPEKWRRLTLGQIVDPTLYLYGWPRTTIFKGRAMRAPTLPLLPSFSTSPSFPLSNQQRSRRSRCFQRLTDTDSIKQPAAAAKRKSSPPSESRPLRRWQI